jgi:hypothetical protein
MMLLSDGTVLVQNGSNPPPSASTFILTPHANNGDYVSGSFAPTTGNMSEGRLFFTTATLPDGRVFAVGGEYPKFSNTAEIFDPTTGLWTSVDPVPTPPTSVFLNGKVTGASNATPIVITTGSTGQLQNGMQVTIAGVNGNTAANGTFTVSNVTATTFQLDGSAGNGTYTGGGKWRAPVPQYGDDPIEVLSTGPNAGQILAGYFNDTRTFRFNPAAAPGSQWTQTAGGKLHGDQSDEEAWVKLKDGSILSYDVFASGGGTFQAQRYIPSMDKWVDASVLDGTNPPSILESNGAQGSEMGPAFLQSDGKVIYFGANGNTAIYDPSTDTWSAGPLEPKKNLTLMRTGPVGNPSWVVSSGSPSDTPTFLVGTDDPGAVLPNGDILITLSPLGPLNSAADGGGYSFPNATYIYEYDPIAKTFTENTPGGLSTVNAFQLNMVVLPTGQVLMSNESNPFQVYTEDPMTGPMDAWRPTISSIIGNCDGTGTFTLKGTQLNGIDEGANYGDDNESASNYPILQFQDGGGNIFYGRTFSWSSSGVATGSTVVTTQFTLPSGKSLSDLATVEVIANGIPSAPYTLHITPNVMAPADQSSVEGASHTFDLGSFCDPDGGPWTVDVNWGDSTTHGSSSASAEGSLGTLSHTFGEEGTYTVTVTVTDSTNLSGSATYKVTVSDPPVVASGVAVSAVEGAAFTASIATFNDPGGAEPNASDSGALANHYKVDSIDWGDSTPLDTSSGTISFDGSTFTVQGSHTYGEEGSSYTITAIVNHEGMKTTVTTTATVSDPAVVATPVQVFAVECRTITVTLATFTDPGGPEPNPSDPSGTLANHYKIDSINWGDLTSLDTASGTISFDGTTSTFTVQGTHAYQHEGVYTVKVDIDHEGIHTPVSTTATIKDDIGLLLLDPTGAQSLQVNGHGIVDATGCGAAIVNSNNSTAAFISGSGQVIAQNIDVTGGATTSSHGTFSRSIDHEAPNADPLGLGLPSAPSPTRSAVSYSGSAPLTLNPGTYVGGIKISGTGPVTLNPGVYYMMGGGFSVSGQASVTGFNVLIVNAPGSSSATISISSQAHVTLTGLTSGPDQGLVMLQDPASSNPVTFTGQSAVITMTGVVYVPNALVQISGNAFVTIDPGAGTATLPPILGALIAFDLHIGTNGVLVINPDDPPAGSMAATASVGANNALNTGGILLAGIVSTGGQGASSVSVTTSNSPTSALTPIVSGSSYAGGTSNSTGPAWNIFAHTPSQNSVWDLDLANIIGGDWGKGL